MLEHTKTIDNFFFYCEYVLHRPETMTCDPQKSEARGPTGAGHMTVDGDVGPVQG